MKPRSYTYDLPLDNQTNPVAGDYIRHTGPARHRREDVGGSAHLAVDPVPASAASVVIDVDRIVSEWMASRREPADFAAVCAELGYTPEQIERMEQARTKRAAKEQP